MDNNIGNMLGIVSHTFSITNEAGDKVKLDCKFDFRSVTLESVRSWLVANRVIAGQRPWRALSKEELIELNGKTFNVNSIGQKIRSRQEQKNDLVNTFTNAGMSLSKAEELAEKVLDNPESLNI